MELRPLIIDKSFAHKVPATRLNFLSKNHCILIPSAFFYEVATTDLLKRKSAIQDFPEFDILHLPSLLRRERELGIPVSQLDYTPRKFDEAFANGTRMLSRNEDKVFIEYAKTLSGMMNFFREVCQRGVIGFSGCDMEMVVRGTLKEFELICDRLRDVGQIRRMAGLIKIPMSEKLDEAWLYFRYLQGLSIYGLALIRSYFGQVEMLRDQKLEHEIHDLEYLVLGLHAGGLATAESETDFRKMGWKFRILAPDGVLVKH